MFGIESAVFDRSVVAAVQSRANAGAASIGTESKYR
jgi:hypothetical protein